MAYLRTDVRAGQYYTAISSFLAVLRNGFFSLLLFFDFFLILSPWLGPASDFAAGVVTLESWLASARVPFKLALLEGVPVSALAIDVE